MTLPTTLGLIGTLGTFELILLAFLGLLIFGKRLPEVGKSVGRGIVEFKKGLSGIEDEIHTAGTSKQEPGKLESDKPGGTVQTDEQTRQQADSSAQSKGDDPQSRA